MSGDAGDEGDPRRNSKDFIIPWVRLRAMTQLLRKEFTHYDLLEPMGPRHEATYFNNRKGDSKRTSRGRLHDIETYDQSKPRCDRTKQSLYWTEIYRENMAHKVPMTTSHWYGRPNRVQTDPPEKKFNRSNKMRELYSRNNSFLIADDHICDNTSVC